MDFGIAQASAERVRDRYAGWLPLRKVSELAAEVACWHGREVRVGSVIVPRLDLAGYEAQALVPAGRLTPAGDAELERLIARPDRGERCGLQFITAPPHIRKVVDELRDGGALDPADPRLSSGALRATLRRRWHLRRPTVTSPFVLGSAARQLSSTVNDVTERLHGTHVDMSRLARLMFCLGGWRWLVWVEPDARAIAASLGVACRSRLTTRNLYDYHARFPDRLRAHLFRLRPGEGYWALAGENGHDGATLELVGDVPAVASAAVLYYTSAPSCAWTLAA